MDAAEALTGPRIVDRPATPEELLIFMGEQIVAFPHGREDLKTSGMLIGLSATEAHIRAFNGTVDLPLGSTVFAEPEDRP